MDRVEKTHVCVKVTREFGNFNIRFSEFSKFRKLTIIYNQRSSNHFDIFEPPSILIFGTKNLNSRNFEKFVDTRHKRHNHFFLALNSPKI